MNKINKSIRLDSQTRKAGLRDGIQQANKWRWRVRARVFDSSKFPVWKIMPFECQDMPKNAVL